jgi:pimeloyl-[acyl-carrier protein] synthase
MSAPLLVRRGNLLEPEILADPYPLYAALRSGAAPEDGRRAVRLYGYADVATVLGDPRFSAARLLPALDRIVLVGLNGEERRRMVDAAAVMHDLLLYTDPPHHDRLRRLLQPFFAPLAVDALRPRIERATAVLLDRVRADGRMDAIADLGAPLPSIVIAGVLGLPISDHDRLRCWSADFSAFTGAGALDPARTERARQSAEALAAYLEPHLAARRRRPRSDLLTALVRAHERGELTAREVQATCLSLLIGGHETTTGLIGNGLLALLRHPDQLALVRQEPDLIDSAIEELARYDSPVQLAARVAAEDLTIGARTIRQGMLVECWLGAANRDPAHFPEPDRLDLRRNPNRHLAFGRGTHFCLGAALGRLEARIAIGAVIRTFPCLRLADEPVTWRRSVIFRCPASLPVVF